ncbi:retinin-like [Drosophila montana]|uniref:retinin-like n=1 Tax=Drosophila montana TaxID=40370 RepID=UPI00313C6A27
MFKLRLSLFAFVLIFVAAASAGSLEWPANLVALSSSKSSQALPLTASEEPPELAESSAAAAAAEPELDQALSESSSADSRLVSAVPVSVPLPLIVAARSGLRSVLTIQEPTLAKVGELVEHVPTAVSHQSQTVVHEHQRLVTPIVSPAVRTTQLVRQQQPLVWTLAADPRVVLLRH